MGALRDGIGAAILERLGIEPIIQAGGPNTKHSGSSPRPESRAAMEFASQHFFQMDELLIAAGKDIARMIGVPAATVTAGAGPVSWCKRPPPWPGTIWAESPGSLIPKACRTN